MLNLRGGIDRVTQSDQAPRILWCIQLHPLLILSALLAIAYGAIGPAWYASGLALPLMALFKATSIILLAMIAMLARSRLLTLALFFGAVGDYSLALDNDQSVIIGATAFLVGHLFYIALFTRAGLGAAALRSPWRLAAMAALVAAAILSTSLLIPQSSRFFTPFAIYTAVLTLMVISSLTLPTTRWLAMAGAVLFFISDGFVAAGMFHPLDDPTPSFWRGFAGWMIYWAGQAALCFGALGLHRPQPAPPA
jgi:uncharacterized membrane protein YhhN